MDYLHKQVFIVLILMFLNEKIIIIFLIILKPSYLRISSIPSEQKAFKKLITSYLNYSVMNFKIFLSNEVCILSISKRILL